MINKEDVRILCLDDAPIILNALKRELELEGYEQVETTTEGEAALGLAAQAPFDLYIVDQTMPNMLGTEFVERLSASQKDALVFILTGQDQEGKAMQLCRQSLDDAGIVVHYFTKPWDSSLFIEVQRALELRRRQQSMERQLKTNQTMANLGLSARKLAHEIRNPLGVISGAAQLLENNINRFEASKQTCTEIIRSEVQRLSNLLDDMSAYNKAGVLKLENGNLNSLLAGVLDLLRIEGRGRNIQCQGRLDPAVPDMAIDGRKLFQTFLNLGKNAIEAMEPEGRLTVTSQYDASRHMVTAQFTDTGCGITPENLDKIFDLFFTSKGHQGSGIGLAIVKQFVLAHSGEIAVESTVGRGSMFTIRLPAKG